jgi:ABC-type Na+ transport system ATPase subunit NatA
MIEFNPVLDAPATAGYHREALEQITECVEEGVYCALLGPRLCGKTLLLHFIEQNLAPLLGWTCVYIDLQSIRATTHSPAAWNTALSCQKLCRQSGVTWCC